MQGTISAKLFIFGFQYQVEKNASSTKPFRDEQVENNFSIFQWTINYSDRDNASIKRDIKHLGRNFYLIFHKYHIDYCVIRVFI